MNIVILDGYTANPGDLTWEELASMGTLTLYERTSPNELIARACEADIILTNKVCLFEKELEALPRLRYIGVLATGYNVVDLETAHRRGIVVTNVPAYSTDSVAQQVFAHLLTVVNRTEHYAILSRSGRWTQNSDFCYWDTPLTELAGKTLGIIGFGNIGTRVSTIAHAFGMNVIALTSKMPSQLPPFVCKQSLDELLSHSDIVSLHCPLTSDTHHLISRQTLGRMKGGTILINTGRGPLVNEQDVADALHSGRLAAYCADVLSTEPPQADNPLLHCPNAFLTPHIAWATREARQRLVSTAVNNVRAFLSGHPVNVV